MCQGQSILQLQQTLPHSMSTTMAQTHSASKCLQVLCSTLRFSAVLLNPATLQHHGERMLSGGFTICMLLLQTGSLEQGKWVERALAELQALAEPSPG